MIPETVIVDFTEITSIKNYSENNAVLNNVRLLSTNFSY